MPQRDILVIGGSSGAIEALRLLLSTLKPDFPAAVFVVIHTSPQTPGVLDRILKRATLLPVAYAGSEEAIRRGTVLLAPADRHLVLKRDRVITTQGPRENRFRPAVDPLFRTAARSHGARVIGIVLSGGQDDGASGLNVIKHHGGIAIVQDPHEAIAPGMPEAAIQHVAVDYIVGVGAMPALLKRLVGERVTEVTHMATEGERRDIAEAGSDNIHRAAVLGPPSPFTCPDCGGTLWEFREGQLVHYQCHIGHRYTADALATAQTEALDHALWAGLRALEESVELRRRMAGHARDRGLAAIAENYDQQAIENEIRADIIRRVLMPEAPETPEHAGALSAALPDQEREE